MTTRRGSTSKYRSKRDMEERLAFIRLYVKRLKENPDEVFRQQVKLINSFLQSAKGFPLTKEEYIRMKEARKRR
ncbi:hypothetical protein [Thermococcus sp. MAR1]|uniref:hypothetical protein n=1 Tax=Thermococcus sp. MAR1 TaxID=1638263 RepID=UPI00143C80D9|nr:hypothetical protein [Thermococcus sp. MAR1]NJE09637.1 hypothetical protein [Thermococcus sp. MAR1]